MRRITVFLFFIFFSSVILYSAKPGNSRIAKVIWNTTNPFQTNVFVENLGQFNSMSDTKEPVRYAVNNADRIFFTDHGLTIKLEKYVSLLEEERENMNKEEDEEEMPESEVHYVSLQWLGSNADVKPETSSQVGGYYTFGEKGFEKIKAKGYQKLIYKNLYNGIDVEYTIHPLGGIKYKLILRQGADLSQVKMKYSGDFDNIILDKDNNLNIETELGNIIDHAPVNNLIVHNNSEANSQNISVNFILKNNTVQFYIPDYYKDILNKGDDIIIDPWTITPTSLTTSNIAYDTDFDDYGNIYISGGSYPFKISKYTSEGTFLWTYTINNWNGTFHPYSRFCVIPNTGTIFLGEGINSSGPRVQKINSQGVFQYMSSNFTGNEEIWVMFYNRCTGKLFGFGGGTQRSNSLQLIADTNLTSSTATNFNGSTQVRNDVASVVQDFNGDFYALITSTVNTYKNQILKSLASNNYAPPCTFNVNSNYSYNETNLSSIPGLSPYNITVRSNALALNGAYLFSYDGRTLYVRNTSDGSAITSVVVNTGYSAGQNRTHEGIAVDECNNIFVGGTNMVHVYSFDGTNLTELTPITTDIPGEVYDVRVDKALNLVYISGNGFLTVAQGQACTVHQFKVVPTVDMCNPSAVIDVTGGTPPYKFQWSNGSTSDRISDVPPGFYYVTVTDNSCNLQKSIDTIQIKSKLFIDVQGTTHICPGSSTQFTASGAANYRWSPGVGLSSTTGSVIIANPTATVVYTVTGTDADGCWSTKNVTLTVTAPNVVIAPANVSICGGSINLKASGASVYKWSPAYGLNTTSGSAVIASPTVTTTYTITGTDQYGCTGTGNAVVTVRNFDFTVNPESVSICKGASVDLTASGGTKYSWSPSIGLNTNTGSVVTASPQSSTVYSVSATDATGCSKVKTVSITVYESNLSVNPPSPSVCKGTSVTIIASGLSNYTWSPATGLSSTTGSSVVCSPSVNVTYTVSGTDSHGCELSQKIPVNTYVLSLALNPQSANICEGKTVPINVSGAINYIWSPSAGLNSTTGSYVVASPATTTTYIVTGTDNNGCTSTGEVSITVKDFSFIISPESASICAGGSVVLSASGASTYSWTPSAGLNTTVGNVVEASPGVNTVYTVSASDANGCSGVKSVSVSIYESPLTIDPLSASICPGASVRITADGLEDYVWSPADGLNTSQGSVVIATPADNITYTVSGSDVHGCSFSKTIEILTDTSRLKVYPKTNVVCAGSSVTLHAEGAKDYTWSPAAGLNTTRGESVVANPVVNTTYIVSAIGCSETTILKDTIVVNALPLPVVYLGKDTVICNDANIILRAGDGQMVYKWNDNSSDPTLYVSASGKYSVTVTDLNGCTAASSINVTKAGKINLRFVNDTTLCPGAELSINASANVPDSLKPVVYTWNNNSHEQSIIILKEGNYSVTVTDKYGCKTSDFVDVSFSNSKLDLGRDTVLETGTTLELNAGDGFVLYQWQDGSQSSTFNVTKKGKYRVTVKDKFGCIYSDTIEVKFLCTAKDPEIHNVFTPFNADIKNNIFPFSTEFMQGQDFIKMIRCMEDFDMKIYNRWGVKIFETNDVAEGWRGQDRGKNAAEGVYFYIITYNLTEGTTSTHHAKSGSVTLMK